MEELPHPEALGEGQVAGGEADLGHGLAPLLRQGVARHAHPARVGEDGAQHHQQRRGLAGAVGPEEADPLARADDQIDPVDGADALEVLDELIGVQDRVHASHSGRRGPANGEE